MIHLLTVAQNFALAAFEIAPNTGPSLENIVFDPTYYSLTALIVIVALVSTASAFRIGKGLSDQRLRDQAMGTGFAALGFAIIFVTATAFLALLRSGQIGGFLYQQAQFLTAYLAAAIILYGVDRTVIPNRPPETRPDRFAGGKRLRAVVWIAFVISVVVAVGLLFDPSAYNVTSSGTTQHVAQQAASWLPPFVVFIAGVSGLSALALRRGGDSLRRHWVWFDLFFALELIGVLRESTVIPSTGDPLVDLLLAFVPFTLGCFCLFASALSFRPALASPGSDRE